ncbi:MAG TPA: hypothetical protein VJ044_07705, partial [Candidatus Hodarchaeales archaeon]|nr:hypothetical protein [Candidatus Hodarchaeales archaeon]
QSTSGKELPGKTNHNPNQHRTTPFEFTNTRGERPKIKAAYKHYTDNGEHGVASGCARNTYKPKTKSGNRIEHKQKKRQSNKVDDPDKHVLKLLVEDIRNAEDSQNALISRVFAKPVMNGLLALTHLI